MFAFLATPLGRDAGILIVVLLLIAGAFGYYEWSQNQMTTLRGEVATVQHLADDLKAANDDMKKNIAAIKIAQDQANQALMGAQTAAADAMAVARKRQTVIVTQGQTTPRAAEAGVNADQAALFQKLRELTQ